MNSSLTSFLKALTAVCKKHHVEEIYTEIKPGKEPTTVVKFTSGDMLNDLEYHMADRGASAYWPRAARFIGK